MKDDNIRQYKSIQSISTSISLGLFRSDYLMQCTEANAIKQVEFNTIASSFGAITSNLPAMSRYILRQLGHGDLIKKVSGYVVRPGAPVPPPLCDLVSELGIFGVIIGCQGTWYVPARLFLLHSATLSLNSGYLESLLDFHDQVPPNRNFVKCIRDLYYEYWRPSAAAPWVGWAVAASQTWRKKKFFSVISSHLKIYQSIIHRKTLNELYEETTVNDKKQLILEGRPVAVVYYRSGYEPSQYPSSREWDARLRVERSSAIKCPSIQYQLAGTKKVQQTLASPGVLEKFMGTGATTNSVRDIFTGLYSLDFDESGERAVDMALADAERCQGTWYVLVRLYLLHSATLSLNSGYLESLLDQGFLKGSPPDPRGTKEKIFSNRQVGHMLRTKLADANEGGVAAGLGALDSPFLLDS
ncbi:Glutathione synthetase, chloroplastic [Papilio machaon]|uniref:Glutathione synthetase n=1 Tax=Papilio machaon TaxID=76193 RepID=A0A194QRX0_PAPMA|nr:Glutathione synthetase, chloroplastic [Papilio machaon]